MEVVMKFQSVTKNYVKYEEVAGINKMYLPKEWLQQFPDSLPPEKLAFTVVVR